MKRGSFMMVQLTLTLAETLLDEAFGSARKHDLMQFVSSVPTVKYVSGNPEFSVRVAIDAAHIGALRKAVEGRCTISEYTDLDLLEKSSSQRPSHRGW
jgi:hypothetical protein